MQENTFWLVPLNSVVPWIALQMHALAVCIVCPSVYSVPFIQYCTILNFFCLPIPTMPAWPSEEQINKYRLQNQNIYKHSSSPEQTQGQIVASLCWRMVSSGWIYQGYTTASRGVHVAVHLPKSVNEKSFMDCINCLPISPVFVLHAVMYTLESL